MAAGRPAVAALLATSLIAAAGCGSGKTRTQADPQPAPAPRERSPFDLPTGVPDRATGPADAASRRVIDAWSRALRRGQVKRAARYWALPSRFQNATPVLTIDTDGERIAVNLALPCGARAVSMDGAGPYTIVTFVLTERPGGNCGAGTGAKARGAIRVASGRIKEWYRLPDRPGAEPLSPSADELEI